MTTSLETLGWIVASLRAALTSEVQAVPVFVGAADDTLAPPYIAVRLQSNQAEAISLCDNTDLESVVVVVNLWHHDLEELARLQRVVDDALPATANQFFFSLPNSRIRHVSLNHARRVGGSLFTENGPQRPRRVNGTDIEGARAELHRATSLWRVDARSYVAANER
jgi:hypothetical protein